jgi:hypothetical protein
VKNRSWMYTWFYENSSTRKLVDRNFVVLLDKVNIRRPKHSSTRIFVDQNILQPEYSSTRIFVDPNNRRIFVVCTVFICISIYNKAWSQSYDSWSYNYNASIVYST